MNNFQGNTKKTIQKKHFTAHMKKRFNVFRNYKKKKKRNDTKIIFYKTLLVFLHKNFYIISIYIFQLFVSFLSSNSRTNPQIDSLFSLALSSFKGTLTFLMNSHHKSTKEYVFTSFTCIDAFTG